MPPQIDTALNTIWLRRKWLREGRKEGGKNRTPTSHDKHTYITHVVPLSPALPSFRAETYLIVSVDIAHQPLAVRRTQDFFDCLGRHSTPAPTCRRRTQDFFDDWLPHTSFIRSRGAAGRHIRPVARASPIDRGCNTLGNKSPLM